MCVYVCVSMDTIDSERKEHSKRSRQRFQFVDTLQQAISGVLHLDRSGCSLCVCCTGTCTWYSSCCWCQQYQKADDGQTSEDANFP